jgi:hypothetical protein
VLTKRKSRSSLGHPRGTAKSAIIRDRESMFGITIIADPGMIAIGADTVWVVADSIGDTELRKASPGTDGHHWSYVLEHHEVVHTRTELQRFLCSGGHALINQTLIKSWWPEFLQPVRCRRHYAPMPWIAIDNPPPSTNERFARGALRQLVFSRDEDRCRICGRSTDDSLDLKLDIHHVLPHSRGGMTNEHNLIVLCRVCHDGIEAFDDIRRSQLYEKIEISFFMQHRSRHSKAVSDYRRHMKLFPNMQSLPSAILPLVWDPKGRSFSRQLVSGMISDNLVTRWYSINQWRKIARQAWKTEFHRRGLVDVADRRTRRSRSAR